MLRANDPVRLGLVESLSRPGGNMTGATQLNMEVAPKRLQIFHELIPAATEFAHLVNPADPTVAEIGMRDAEAAARAHLDSKCPGIGVTQHHTAPPKLPTNPAPVTASCRTRSIAFVLVRRPMILRPGNYGHKHPSKCWDDKQAAKW
jgi:hypothetical protein